MRFYKAVSSYPAYKHVSFNAEHRTLPLTVHLSFHVKYAWRGGGFWFGLRPEFEIHRGEDKLREFMLELSQSPDFAKCARCEREEIIQKPERAYDRGWQYITMRQFCPTCVNTLTARELIDG